MSSQEPSNSLEWVAAMATLDEQIQLVKASMESGNTQKATLVQQVAEFEKAIRELKYQVTQIDSDQFETKRDVRRLERERESAERRLRIALENEALAEEIKRLGVEYDRLTIGAPWREFAKDYQIVGAKTLAAANKGILADKMGLGKTLTCLAWADMLQAKKIVAFVPNDTMTNFKREVAKWSKRKAYILGNMPKQSRHILLETLENLDEFVIIINYEAWRKDFKTLDLINTLRPDAVIADEAHVIKDRKSLAYRGVKHVVHAQNQCNFCSSPNITTKESYYGAIPVVTCENCGETPNLVGDFSSVKYVLPMTGTPILNRPQDLFSLLHLIDPQKFYNEYRYLDDFCTRDPYTNKWKFSSGGLERLTASLSNKFIMRDRKSVGLELPPQEIVEYELELTEEEYPKQWSTAKALNAYAQLILQDNTKADGAVALNILYIIALITRKRQVMTWAGDMQFQDGDRVFKVDCDESIKIDRIIRYTNGEFDEWDGLIPDVTNNGELAPDGTFTGERVVVFSQFKQPLKELERRCREAGISVVRYDGDTPDDIAEQVKIDVDRSANGAKPKWQVILANYKKGGVGLNFTDITHTIILDEEWNPGKRDQAYGRTHRIGQTQETTVHILRVTGSIDTWLENLITTKQNMIDGFESNMELSQALLEYLSDENSL